MPSPTRRPPAAFSLIELLIVVSILAILTAIAVPNFLEAQIRAKVSRAKADLRTIAGALESYRVDEGAYPPNDGVFNVVPLELSTPVAYLTGTGGLLDPFTVQELHPVYGELVRYYTYAKVVDPEEFLRDVTAGRSPPIEAVDQAGFHPGAFRKYGDYRLLSLGPDQRYADLQRFAGDAPVYGSDVLYDPSNGTVSWGNILRTQRSPEGRVDP